MPDDQDDQVRNAVIQSDLRDPAAILAHPDTGRLIDLTQPLAILFVAVLHFVPDPDAQQAVTAFTSVAAPRQLPGAVARVQ